MIVSQSMSIKSIYIKEIMKALRKAEYKVEDLRRVDYGLAFDVKSKDGYTYVRFLRGYQSGNLTGVQMTDLDHTGLHHVLSFLCPFIGDDQEAYVMFTGEHDEALEGYFVRPDGIYAAENIHVTATRGLVAICSPHKIEERNQDGKPGI